MKYIVEVVIWHDAAKTDRDKFTEELMILGTVGVVFKENRKMIYVLHEFENQKNFVASDMDYTEIPRKMILQRIPVGEIDVPIELKKIRRRVTDGKEAQPEGVVGISKHPSPSG